MTDHRQPGPHEQTHDAPRRMAPAGLAPSALQRGAAPARANRGSLPTGKLAKDIRP